MSSEEPFDFSHFLSMIGHSIIDVHVQRSGKWAICFELPARIEVMCPWRLLRMDMRNWRGEELLIGIGDHLQDRGPEEPFDAAQSVATFLRNKKVTRLDVNDAIGDLTLDFTDNLRLQIIPFAFNDWAWSLMTMDSQEITWESNALLCPTLRTRQT